MNVTEFGLKKSIQPLLTAALSKLSKKDIAEIVIKDAVRDVLEPANGKPLRLRLTGHLLLGVVIIYREQVKQTVSECNDIIMRIKLQVTPDTSLNLQSKSVKSAPVYQSITLPERLTEIDLTFPEPKDILAYAGKRKHMTDPRNISIGEGWIMDFTSLSGLSSRESTPEQERRGRTPLGVMNVVDDDAVPFDIPDFIQRETPSDHGDSTPSEGTPLHEEIDVVDIPELEQNEEDEQRGALVSSIGRKKKVIVDHPAFISRAQFETQLKNTSDIMREFRECPLDKKEVEARKVVSIKTVFAHPSLMLPKEIESLFQKAWDHATKKDTMEDEIENQEREAMDDDMVPDIGAPDIEEDSVMPSTLDILEEPTITDTGLNVIAREEKDQVNQIVAEMKSKLVGKGYTNETLTFLHILRESWGDQPEPLSVTSLVAGQNRLVASQCFYQSLVLKTRNLIHLEQVSTGSSSDVWIHHIPEFDAFMTKYNL